MIPKYQKRPKTPAVHVYPDGREVCSKTAAGKREYDRRKWLMWIRQIFRCGACRRKVELHEGQFGHSRSRGFGGGFRDDRIWDADGEPMNAFLCGTCNMAQGSRAFEWRDGIFQSVEKAS